MVAHELRNPMTPIRGQIELLLSLANREGASSRLVQRLQRLNVAVESYIRRATALLETTRLAAGRVRLQPTSVDLSAVVHEIVDMYRPAAARARCRVQAIVEEGVVGQWDRLALEQVSENLLSNALKYGAGTPVSVLLAADASDARLVVRDHGPGIRQEDYRRIFLPFEQLALSGVRRQGIGIGLWVSRQLAEAMGGAIEVDSVVGQGCAFTVRLPLAGAAGQDDE